MILWVVGPVVFTLRPGFTLTAYKVFTTLFTSLIVVQTWPVLVGWIPWLR